MMTNLADQKWHYNINDIAKKWDLLEFKMIIEKALRWRIGKPKIVKEIVDVMKELQEKGFLLTIHL